MLRQQSRSFQNRNLPRSLCFVTSRRDFIDPRGLTRTLPVLSSKFFAIVGIELRFGAYSLQYLRELRVERDVPTAPLAKPAQPHWGGCKDKTTLVPPLHDGGAWVRLGHLTVTFERSGHTGTNVLPHHHGLAFVRKSERTLRDLTGKV